MSTRTGRVSAFDEHAGHGTVRADGADGADGTGGEEFFFHCTAIADGSRTIEPDSTVTFVVVAGHNGQWEASEVRPTR